MTTERTFTFAWPMKLNSGGAIAQDTTSDSQVQLLSHTEIGQRIDDRSYGFPPYAYEQESLADSIRQPITLLLTQQAIVQFIPTLLLQSIEVVRDPAKRKLAMAIEYLDRNRFSVPTQTQFGLGLEEG